METIYNKIFIIGGHLTPAIAIIDEIIERKIKMEIIFVGRKYAFSGDKYFSEEYKLIKNRGLFFLPLVTGRTPQPNALALIRSVILSAIGLFQSFYYCLKYKPKLIVSFGGYLALPICLVSFIIGIPIITHEQTLGRGKANRIIGFFSKVICLSFDDKHKLFPPQKAIVTGLPIRKSILYPPKSSKLNIKTNHPLIYITGGATGSLSVNRLIYTILPELLIDYTVVHQVGRNNLDQAMRIKRTLPQRFQTNYLPHAYLEENEHSWLLHQAKLVISRSGANTVAEIAMAAKVSLQIPLPWSAGNEQYYNALFLANAGSAEIFHQDKDSNFLLQITHMLDAHDKYLINANELAQKISKNGTENLLNEIVKIYNFA